VTASGSLLQVAVDVDGAILDLRGRRNHMVVVVVAAVCLDREGTQRADSV